MRDSNSNLCLVFTKKKKKAEQEKKETFRAINLRIIPLVIRWSKFIILPSHNRIFLGSFSFYDLRVNIYELNSLDGSPKNILCYALKICMLIINSLLLLFIIFC